ncbi:hypothetical protein [Microbulbifer litoralis]|uniref:hypothetical protein n=1 Tax=Microbulbifer litoralis TaxID=2933965 RepID=UPI002027A503|nr:hypothetical protein [Microbulbifer sp. GX H0434]
MYRNTLLRFPSFACLALFLAGCSLTESPRPPFEGLGDLPGGKISSSASAVSADGRVVVGQSSSAEDSVEAYRWEDGEMTPIGTLRPGDLSSANDVSADGATVVGTSFNFSGGSPSLAFVWRDGDMRTLDDFPCGDMGCSALAVSGDGSIVVGKSGWRYGEKERPFIWTEGAGMRNLQDVLENRYGVDLHDWVLGHAEHISDDGSVIAGSGLWDDTAYDAFRWTEGDSTGVSLPGMGSANAISPDGSALVGNRSTRLERAGELVLWKEREAAVLASVQDGGPFIARGVSACGSVVVGFGNFGDGEEAFIWSETDGMRKLKGVLENEHHLELAGWTLKRAEGISNDGTVIVGSGTNPQGNREAWRAVLHAPEAPTANLSAPEAGCN